MSAGLMGLGAAFPLERARLGFVASTLFRVTRKLNRYADAVQIQLNAGVGQNLVLTRAKARTGRGASWICARNGIKSVSADCAAGRERRCVPRLIQGRVKVPHTIVGFVRVGHTVPPQTE